MQKETAIQLLGGSIKAASEAIGVTYWAVYKWPDTLPTRISDRVEAALARSHTSNVSRKQPKNKTDRLNTVEKNTVTKAKTVTCANK